MKQPEWQRGAHGAGTHGAVRYLATPRYLSFTEPFPRRNLNSSRTSITANLLFEVTGFRFGYTASVPDSLMPTTQFGIPDRPAAFGRIEWPASPNWVACFHRIVRPLCPEIRIYWGNICIEVSGEGIDLWPLPIRQ